MTIKTVLTQQLGISYPVIQAPMAGGATTPDLVAAVSEAGGFGFIAGAYLTAAQIEEVAHAVRSKTSKPFGINLFAPLAIPNAPNDVELAVQRVGVFHTELGLPPPQVPTDLQDPFEDLLPAVLKSGASAFSFTFGIPPSDAINAIKGRGMLVFGTATTVEEAGALQAAGVDAIVVQGSEAGAHRGSFAVEFEAAMVGTMALVPQVVDAVQLPVIASGGIMDGRGLVAALALGAAAVQMGTAFLTCDEAGIPDAYKQALLTAREHETQVTRAFSGRPARGIVNRFMQEIDCLDAPGAILPYPLQNALTRPLRTAAAKANLPEYLSLWAGQGLGLAKRQPAAELIAQLKQESEYVIRQLTALSRSDEQL